MRKEVINSAGEIEKAGCIIVDDSGKLLLVRNLKSNDPWGLPKGHVELGESFLESALRETREESGIEVRVIRQLPDLTYKHGRTGQPIRVHLWFGKPNGELGQSEAGESHAWVDMEEAKRRVFPNVSDYIEQIRSLIVVD